MLHAPWMHSARNLGARCLRSGSRGRPPLPLRSRRSSARNTLLQQRFRRVSHLCGPAGRGGGGGQGRAGAEQPTPLRAAARGRHDRRRIPIDHGAGGKLPRPGPRRAARCYGAAAAESGHSEWPCTRARSGRPVPSRDICDGLRRRCWRPMVGPASPVMRSAAAHANQLRILVLPAWNSASLIAPRSRRSASLANSSALLVLVPAASRTYERTASSCACA